MAFIRPVTAFRTLLLSKPDITAETTYIYGPPGIPAGLANSMPVKAITLLKIGGTYNVSIPVARPMIAMRCYGETSREADVLYSIVAQELGFMAAPIKGRRLQNELISYGADNCYLYAIHKMSGPMDLMEREEEWPYVWSSWSFLHFQLVPGDI